ncbi:MAG: hypothetical protein JXA33_03045 [Anaerolineae bacterium]|nr:hypothetical protein [Anaerolineae bacterium]
MNTHIEYNRSTLTTALRYDWVNVTATKRADEPLPWIQPAVDTIEALIESIVAEKWRVAFLRQQLRRLKIKANGRTRVDLTRQLIEGFLIPERLTHRLEKLSNEQRIYYTYELLNSWLKGLQTTPIPPEQLYDFSQPATTLYQEIAAAGLGLESEEGLFFVPYAAFRLLPSLTLPFPVVTPPPSGIGKRVDYQIFGVQIQQFLSLLQSGTYYLRARPRWQLPNYAYMGTRDVWPPIPESVQRILSQQNFQGKITLCPSIPFPDDNALAAWSSALDLPVSNVEFLYHILAYAGLIRPGRPIQVDTAAAQTWMTLSLARQIQIVFDIYQHLNEWAAWFPQWRSGEIAVKWDYQYYWSLVEVDRTLTTNLYVIRDAILDVLSFLPQDSWLTVESVVELLIRIFPQSSNLLYYRNLDMMAGRDLREQNWRDFLHTTVYAMLRGPLYWLGLVEVFPDPDTFTLFRMHHLQDMVWGRNDALPVQQEIDISRQNVIFLPDQNELRITPPVPADFLQAVQMWAEPVGLAGHILRYRLHLRRLHAAFEEGETPDTLASAWREHAGFVPMPEIMQWWQLWWDRYGHIRLYKNQASLITRDEFTLREIQIALPNLRDSIMGLVTPRVALLQSEQVDRVLADLERQGYMPKEEQ